MEENKSLALIRAEQTTIEALVRLSAAPGTDVAAVAMQEIEYYNQIAMYNQSVRKCEPISVLLAIKSVLKKNLSLDPSEGLVYATTRSLNVGTDANPEWKTILELKPTANGAISEYRQCGRILDIKRPVIEKDEKGKVVGVSVEVLLPSYPEPRWETYSFDESDILRWRAFSHKEKSRNKPDAATKDYSNKLYSSHKGGADPEFIRAKAIKHGLKKLGKNQNEVKFGVITKFEPTVDVKVDMVSEDEYTETTPYEEVDKFSADRVNINIPNSDQL